MINHETRLNIFCADTLAVAISKITSTKKLSAFKRNDYLAIALGYKGHSGLIHAVKFHSQQDAGEQLRLFCHAGITSAIIETYCSKITGLDRKQFVLACEHLSERGLVSDAYKLSINAGLQMKDALYSGRELASLKPLLDVLDEIDVSMHQFASTLILP